jgi:hypothetical protein
MGRERETTLILLKILEWMLQVLLRILLELVVLLLAIPAISSSTPRSSSPVSSTPATISHELLLNL